MMRWGLIPYVDTLPKISTSFKLGHPGFERNRVAKMFELPRVVAFDLLGPGAFEVIGPRSWYGLRSVSMCHAMTRTE